MSEKKYERGRKRETEREIVRTGMMRERGRSEKVRDWSIEQNRN